MVEKLFFLVPFTHRRSGAAAAVVRNGDQVAPLSGTGVGVGVGGASSRLTAAQEHDRQGTKIDALAVWEKKRRKASAA